MELLELMKQRYSCKKFSEKQVCDDALECILEAGRLAPTAKNLQGHKVYVIRSEEGLKKVDSLTPCRYGARTVLLVSFNKDETYAYPGGKRDSGVEDATIVATHMLLAAAYKGVDSCWINCFDPDEVAKTFELPDREEVLMMLDLGYAAEGAGPLANHEKRKGLTETVVYC